MPGNNSFFNAIEINGQLPNDVMSKPAIIEGRYTQLLKDIYSLSNALLEGRIGEVFLINGHSHQFTMRSQDRDITCVATSDAQRDQIDLLSYGDQVFVRGRLRKRQQRDLIQIQALRVGRGLTVT
jgi:tRNA(Ile2) C34 agmatinyltransferase TiaS